MTTAHPDTAAGGMHLRAVGSFHVGGRAHRLTGLPVEQLRLAQQGPARAVDPNGTHITGQMYAQYFLQQEPRIDIPLLLWHGGGMTGANWEATPDGRPGWLQRLLERGHDVYVCDAVERGRAGWSRWPEIYAGPPLFRTLEEGWDMFRVGPPGQVHPGQQFPVGHFETFAAQWVPRWADHDEATLDAYEALLERVGPCALIAHSQGGGFALAMTRRRPDLVRAVIAVEPSGAPPAAEAVADLPPHLVIWGDHFDHHPVWQRYRSNVDAYIAAARARGCRAEQMDLPRLGVTGNSHFPMLDLNADQVLARALTWLESALQPPRPERST